MNTPRHAQNLPAAACRRPPSAYAWPRRLTVVVALLIGTAATAADRRGDALLLALEDATAIEVDALKGHPGVGWWLELGDRLLVVADGDGAMLRQALAGRGVVADLGSLAPDDLVLHARGCAETAEAIPQGWLVWRGATHDLLRRPKSFAPAPPLAGGDGPLGPAWLPVAANSTLARMHRLDRPEGVAPDPGIAPIVDRVDAARWFQTVSTLTGWDRSSWSPQLPLARAWIAGEFAALGLAVSEPTFNFPPGNTPAPIANVIGTWTGTHEPDQWIVVGGHYDSRNANNSAAGAANTPGADDNASGCSGVIEAARAVVPFRPRRSVLFMCYAGEEQGLHGSHGHVNALTSAGDLGRVQAMLNMDMIGWAPDSNLGVNVATQANTGTPGANLALVDVVADAALAYAPALNPSLVLRQSTTCCSDHWPYLLAGRPAVMSIHRFTTSYPQYHQVGDTPAALGPFAQAIGGSIVRMNVGALSLLAGASDRIFVDGWD
ncbi:MAG: M28 family peptidase [Xanthomonadales bacterium]|nr:M28 family peptidase [Xanthomonadales bacterium]